MKAAPSGKRTRSSRGRRNLATVGKASLFMPWALRREMMHRCFAAIRTPCPDNGAPFGDFGAKNVIIEKWTEWTRSRPAMLFTLLRHY